jgi:IPT/TIG domain
MRKLRLVLVCCVFYLSCAKNQDSNTPPTGNATPSIMKLSVINGIVGDTVVIYGTNFSTTASYNSVEFNGTAAQIISATDNSIVVVVPAGTSTGNLTLSVNGQASSNSILFTALSANIYSFGYCTKTLPYTIGVYFKNGIEAGYIVGAGTVYLSGMYVSGKDIYFCGYETNSNNIPFASYWKNGVQTKLTDGTKLSTAGSIWVSGTDTYVTGVDGTGIYYWKNGNLVNIPVVGTFKSGAANLIFISGSDIYLSGTYLDASNNLIAAYWKNGVQVNLPGSLPTPYSIFVSGNDVYVAGTTYNNATQINTAVYWKNGVVTSLSDGILNYLAKGIYVTGSDVYVSGFEGSGNDVSPLYWKNGNKVALTPGPGITSTISGTGGNIIIGCGYKVPTSTGAQPGFWYNDVFQSITLSSNTQLSSMIGIFVQAP